MLGFSQSIALMGNCLNSFEKYHSSSRRRRCAYYLRGRGIDSRTRFLNDCQRVRRRSLHDAPARPAHQQRRTVARRLLASEGEHLTHLRVRPGGIRANPRRAPLRWGRERHRRPLISRIRYRPRARGPGPGCRGVPPAR